VAWLSARLSRARYFVETQQNAGGVPLLDPMFSAARNWLSFNDLGIPIFVAGGKG
jgi:hypothetical protein